MDFLSPWISERMINYTSNEAVFDALKQRNIVVSKISGRNKPVLGSSLVLFSEDGGAECLGPG